MSPRELLNHSYFIDALSGRFLSPTDDKRREHTLGRLLMATMENGEVTDPNSHNTRYTYRPLWATMISSIVHVSHWDIRSLRLESEDLAVQFTHTLEHPQRKLVITSTVDQSSPYIKMPMGLGPNQDSTQQLVTMTAQDFFKELSGIDTHPYGTPLTLVKDA